MAGPTGSYEAGTYRRVVALNAVTATTTSEDIIVAGAKKVTLYMTRANHSSGSSAFSVDVSGDGTTYIDYNKLITNVTNTNGQDVVRAASVSLAADGSAIASIDLVNDAVYSIKVTVVETTDGTHSCSLVIEY